MEIIPNFSRYTYSNGVVVDTKSDKIMKPQNCYKSVSKRYKLKDNLGTFRTIAESKIKKLLFDYNTIPPEIKKIPDFEDYFIGTNGRVYSLKTGELTELSQNIGTKGYASVRLPYKSRPVNREVHWLMCHTFLMKDYSKYGYCCMHLNNIKTDNILSNLKVATYSENNKAAYDDGLNPGNGLKK